jgi:hypothetical protein
MKRFVALVIIAVFSWLTNPAHATTCKNGAKDYPKCTPPVLAQPALPAAPVYVGGSPWAQADAGAQSESESEAAAISGSKSGSRSTAAGGRATGGAGGTSGASLSDIGNSVGGDTNVRSLSLFVPPPVFTPPMPRPEVPVHCPAPTETQSALSFGSGVLFSKADSMRDNDPCTAIKYSQLLWDRCQYQKADRALAVGLKLFARKAGEEWDAAADQNLTNYAPKDCVVLSTPPAPKPPELNFIYVPPQVSAPPEPPACTTPPVAKRRKPSCTRPKT